jgi:hypothetical protein
MIDRARLAKLLGMLGSDHEGERANAARLASEMVRTASTTWKDIVNGGQVAIEAARRLLVENDGLREEITRLRTNVVSRAPEPWASAECARDTVEALLLWPVHITDWERRFLESLLARTRRPTSKQYACLVAIGEKVDHVIRSSWRRAS